jgi:hypothetical protein
MRDPPTERVVIDISESDNGIILLKLYYYTVTITIIIILYMIVANRSACMKLTKGRQHSAHIGCPNHGDGV